MDISESRNRGSGSCANQELTGTAVPVPVTLFELEPWNLPELCSEKLRLGFLFSHVCLLVLYKNLNWNPQLRESISVVGSNSRFQPNRVRVNFVYVTVIYLFYQVFITWVLYSL